MTIVEKEALAMSTKILGKVKEMVINETKASIETCFHQLHSSINRERDSLQTLFSSFKATLEKKVEEIHGFSSQLKEDLDSTDDRLKGVQLDLSQIQRLVIQTVSKLREEMTDSGDQVEAMAAVVQSLIEQS